MAQALQPTTVMSDDEALGWLIQQGRQGPVEASARELARRFGWPDDDAGRIKVGRRLKRWQEDGLIVREPTPNGRQKIVIGTLNATVNIAVVQPVNVADNYAKTMHEPARPGVHHLGAVVLALLALLAAACGLRISSEYGASLGRTPQAAATFAWLSFMAAGAAFVLPSAAQALWRGDRRGAALVAWSLAGLVLIVEVLAAMGFYSLNIADTTAGRGKIAKESATLTAQVARLTAERSAIAEARAVASLDALISGAQGSAAPVWTRTSGCTDITRRDSSDACTAVLALRQARGEAARRDTIDGEMRTAQAALAALPAVTSADPQAETAAAFATWVSRGLVAPTATDIAMVRIGGMTALPQIAGLLFMLAVSLWGLRRNNDGSH